ncbi:hypothetical protein Pint_30620 [Pistacia integerrima]|uniref:Uncharacterized protein n=1 Tax=Pistacia integerrima TaxID=434235 RepID=A0ACC0WZP2_9ROSI|nr:hypothetical protein Pint_30620 [Pistacia integerrima]
MCTAVKYLRRGRPPHQLCSEFNLLLLFYLLNFFPILQVIGISSLQVNGVDLAEIAGGEVAITNLHSCNGSWTSQEANARLKCVYFSVTKKLSSKGCGVPENYETFSCVAIRHLGCLLPDARWVSSKSYEFKRMVIFHISDLHPTWLPFMDLRQKKGDKAHLLKRCCSRAKCFIGRILMLVLIRHLLM